MARKKRPQREDLDTIWDLDIERISKAAKGDAISEAIGHNLSSLAIEKHPETLRTYGEMTQDELLLVISILKAQVEIQARNFFETDEELRKLVHALPAIQRQKSFAQARAKAFKGHAATHHAKRTVFEWCDQHHHEYPKDMDGMATAITESKPLLVNQKWDTVRVWITEWKKVRKLGAASKPDSN